MAIRPLPKKATAILDRAAWQGYADARKAKVGMSVRGRVVHATAPAPPPTKPGRPRNRYQQTALKAIRYLTLRGWTAQRASRRSWAYMMNKWVKEFGFGPVLDNRGTPQPERLRQLYEKKYPDKK